MRKISLAWLSLALMAPGCSEPDVQACEAFTKETLSSPISYRRVNVSVIDDTPMTFEQILKETGQGKLGRDSDPIFVERRNLLEARTKSPGVTGLRRMALTFDADNEFGSSIRSGMVCAFLLKDGKLAEPDSLDTSVGFATSDWNRRRMAAALSAIPEASKLPEPPRRDYPCCLE